MIPAMPHILVSSCKPAQSARGAAVSTRYRLLSAARGVSGSIAVSHTTHQPGRRRVCRSGSSLRLEVREQREQPGAEGDQQAPAALLVALAADVAFDDARDAAAQIVGQRADLPRRQQVRRLGRGIAVQPAQHVGDVAVHLVPDAVRGDPLALASRPVEPGMGTALGAPVLGAAAEQDGLQGGAEAAAPAVQDQPFADVIVDPHAVEGVRRGGDDAGGSRPRARADPFVGIDLEDPVAGTGGDAGIAALALQLPAAFQHAGAMQRAIAGACIRAAVEDDDDSSARGEAASQSQAGSRASLLRADYQGGEARADPRPAGLDAWSTAPRPADSSPGTGVASRRSAPPPRRVPPGVLQRGRAARAPSRYGRPAAYF